MTSSQRNSLIISRWPAACRAQGWKVSDRALRLRVLSVGLCLCNDANRQPSQVELLAAIRSNAPMPRTIASANALNTKEDVDAVFACLGLLSDDLDRASEVGHPELGEARRLLWRIKQQTKRLGWSYVNRILRDKFGHTRLDDLTVEQLTQLRNTLHARLFKRDEPHRSNPITPLPALAGAAASDSDDNEPF